MEKAYKNSDVVKLRGYIGQPKILSTEKFTNYLECSFVNNREVYDILVLILLNQYDLNDIVVNMIDRDNIDLMEDIFNYKTELVLDHKRLIPLTVLKGRISMAKLIYEYNHGNIDSYDSIIYLLEKYKFVIDLNEKSIDSFVLGLYHGYDDYVEKTMPYINPNFWDNFAIKLSVNNYEYSVRKPNAKRLLLHSMVDPGVDNNYPLKIAINKKKYEIANELLKHPLVTVDNITQKFVIYLISHNCLCVAERILRSHDDITMIIFKQLYIINLLIECHNDVTYLAIKLGIFDVVQLINYYPEQKRKIKKYLDHIVMDKIYVVTSYEYNLDPHQIFETAIKTHDMDLAKSIYSYPISMNIGQIFEYLKYSEFGCKTKSVSSYIWNEILSQYDPNELLIEVLYRGKKWSRNAFDLIHYFDLKINYNYVWDNCEYGRIFLWNDMKNNYEIYDCEQFIIYIGGELGDDYCELVDDNKMIWLDNLYKKIG